MYYSPDHILTPAIFRPLLPSKLECIHEQGSGPVNEDVLFFEGDLFGVFDGATSLGRRVNSSGKTGGLRAAEIAAGTFARDFRELPQVAAEANRRIALAQGEAMHGARHGIWSASMAVVRLCGGSMEYCRLGDAVILLVMEDGSFRLVTPDKDIDRETLAMWKEQGDTDGSIYELLGEQIQRVRQRMNIDYGVLNGEPEAMGFLDHGRLDLAGVRDILLTTDGLFLPREDPEKEHDWQRFAELYLQGGLVEVRNHVRSREEQDPGCRRYPRFKAHDDIAALAISL